MKLSSSYGVNSEIMMEAFNCVPWEKLRLDNMGRLTTCLYKSTYISR